MTKAQKIAQERNLSKGRVAALMGMLKFLIASDYITRTEKAWMNDALSSLKSVYKNWAAGNVAIKRKEK